MDVAFRKHTLLLLDDFPEPMAQVARMNRTIKETTVKRYHYDSHQWLYAHLHDFSDSCNYDHRLKGLMPF